MKTIPYSIIKKRFQYTAGISALDNWEASFFENSLNHRLRYAWQWAEWPSLVELNYRPVDELGIVGAQVECLNNHPVKTPPSTGLVIGDVVEITGTWPGNSDSYTWAQPSTSYGLPGEKRKVTVVWQDSTAGSPISSVIGEELEIISTDDKDNKKYERSDGSFIYSTRAEFQSNTERYVQQGVGGFNKVNELGKGGQDSFKFVSFPDLDVLNLYDRNPFEDTSAREINFRLIDSLLEIDPSYTASHVWLLTRKPFEEVISTGSVPAMFETFLVSATLADFYRADGQQNKAMYEEAQAEEALTKQLDRIERQNQQARVSVITYKSPNSKRHAQI